jgi:proline utilization trans-activator
MTDCYAETFLPWDLDALFVSTMIIILTGFIHASLPVSQSTYLDKAFGLLEYMASNGNRIATFRIIELRKLDEMLETYLMDQMQLSSTSIMHGSGSANHYTSLGSSFPEGHQSTARVDDSLPPPPTGLSDEWSGFGDDLTVEQILAGAESIDFETTDWLSFATLENDYPMVDPHA